ncbi:hypothetical protein CAPTEDRAFT_95344, partial [Capitella teleta]
MVHLSELPLGYTDEGIDISDDLLVTIPQLVPGNLFTESLLRGSFVLYNSLSHVESCPLNTFACKDKSCVLITHVCDGEMDCFSGEDEIYCYPPNCTCIETHFQCSSGQCIPLEKLCNDIQDCSDASDEFGCAIRASEWAACPDQYKCHKSYCIPLHRVCDGVYDCPRKDDETGCAALLCVGLFKCKHGTCLHPKLLCND